MLANMDKLLVNIFARLEGESVRSTLCYEYCSLAYMIYPIKSSDGLIQADPGLYQSCRQHNNQFHANCSFRRRDCSHGLRVGLEFSEVSGPRAVARGWYADMSRF